MPQNASKHTTEQVVTINSQTLAGGMNNSAPADSLNNQVPLIQNMYYDYSSGFWRTRWPFRRYSASAASADNAVKGICNFNDEFVFSCNQNLYYLNSSLAPTLIGALNASDAPCFLPFNSVLLMATGSGIPQQMNTSRTLASITGTSVPATAMALLEKNGQVVLVGVTAAPDYAYESAQFDHTVWSGGTSEYYRIRCSADDQKIIGVCRGPSEYSIFFKRGRTAKETWMVDANATWSAEGALKCVCVSTNEAAHTNRCAVYAANNLWIMDKHSGPLSFQGVDATEKVIVNPKSLEIGERILSNWAVDDNAFMCVYPPHGQLWFFPSPSTSNTIWVLHYRTGAWSKFVPAGNLNFWSAYYHPATGALLLGGSDGFIYSYDENNTDGGDYQDEPGGSNTNFVQKLRSKVYSIYPYYRHVVKSPVLVYRGLSAGAGTMTVSGDYGGTIKMSETFTVVNEYATLADYATTAISALATTIGTSSPVTNKRWDRDIDVDNIQFEISVTDGAWEFHSFMARIAQGTQIIV